MGGRMKATKEQKELLKLYGIRVPNTVSYKTATLLIDAAELEDRDYNSFLDAQENQYFESLMNNLDEERDE